MPLWLSDRDSLLCDDLGSVAVTGSNGTHIIFIPAALALIYISVSSICKAGALQAQWAHLRVDPVLRLHGMFTLMTSLDVDIY